MKKLKKTFLFVGVIIIVLLLMLPILAPYIHTGKTPKSAIRKYIYEQGHPYQSYIAMIKTNGKDAEHGLRYDVTWVDYNDPTDVTGNIFYVKKNPSGFYVVSSGTAP